MAWMIGNELKNDWLVGTAGDDTMKGLGGNDTLKGGGGADYIDGGAGMDTAMYVDSASGVVVDLRTGRGQYGTAEGDALVSIENIYGSAYRDYLFGNDVANQLRGLDGDDVLFGRGGNDFLDGGYGNDVLAGDAGADTIDGGAGYDTVTYIASPTGVSFALINGIEGSGGDAEGDWIINVEALDGSQYNDVLWGDDADNQLNGWRGDDQLNGFGGADLLKGDEGNDRLHGGDGRDHLQGGAGNDRIEGGLGADDLTGGAGADVFAWAGIGDTGTTPSTGDFIQDFNPAEGDRIDLSGIDANRYAVGDQAFTFVGSAPLTNRIGQMNYVHQDGMTIIQMQTDRWPGADGIICLNGIVTPEASWFVL